MITIRNKRNGEKFTISNAVKADATIDSFCNDKPITSRTLQNWHAIFDYKLLLGMQGNKAYFQFSLKDHLEVVL